MNTIEEEREQLNEVIQQKFGIYSTELESFELLLKDFENLMEQVKKLTIPNVSQQRELLIAYEKHHYTPSEWALASKQCEKEIDDFLAINCG